MITRRSHRAPILVAGGILALTVTLAGCADASGTPTAEMPTVTSTAPPSQAQTPVPTSTPSQAQTPVPTSTPSNTAGQPRSVSVWTDQTLWDACMAAWALERPELDPSRFTPFDAANITDNTAGGVPAFYVASYVIDPQGPEDQPRDCAITGTPDSPTIVMNPPLD
ncbi:hypothetical protein [Leifsonia sp. A12D58]|uniref:hypothetical protein n=1 Tax=Leifsonia sp. A12D58 TaxID=3397674 RepID=UPI0039DF5E27